MPSGPARAAVGRRALLLGAAALLAGCGRARPSGAPGGTVLRPRVGDRDLYALVPGLAAAFNAAHRGVSVAAGAAAARGSASPYALVPAPAPAEGAAGGLVPLDAALHQDGFAAGGVAPQVLGLYRVQGALLGLPVAQWPIAVRWRADVFAAAGLAAPAPDWTVADFEAACLAIAALIPSGRVPGLQAVLFPMGDGPGSVPGALAQPGWWSAFALGYGGTVVQGGRFAFDSNAVLGLGALAGFARRFGSRPAGDAAALPAHCAMALDYWTAGGGAPVPSLEATVPGLRFGATWRWARAPVFPRRPVVTTWVGGEGLVGPAAGPAAGVGLAAAAEALLWLLGETAQALLAAWGAPPVLAAASAQHGFWQVRGAGDRAAGDWKRFQPYAAGWPGPPGAAPMRRALATAAANPSALQAQVAQAAQQMNAQVEPLLA